MVPPVVATTLVLALLACTEVAAEGPTICDTVQCGKGTCRETPGLIPLTTSYNCTCDLGWTQLLGIPLLPCIFPDPKYCHFDPLSCFNLSLSLPKNILAGITDPCEVINCGPGGECKKGDGLLSYSCECHQPGYANLLNFTALPCVNKNCVFGEDCSKLGITPPPPSTAPPPGNHDSSAPPIGPKGNATALGFVPSSWRLLQLLLLLSLAMVQLV